jgi:transposase
MFTMGSTHRRFTPEFKDEAVMQVINSGRPVAVVARELGLQEQNLGRWVNLFKARHDVVDRALTESELAELVRLRKDNAELMIDRAFLKKASLYFAQEVIDANAKRSR